MRRGRSEPLFRRLRFVGRSRTHPPVPPLFGQREGGARRAGVRWSPRRRALEGLSQKWPSILENPEGNGPRRFSPVNGPGGEVLLLPGERLDRLGRDGLLRIIQHPRLFRFSIDAYLLAACARPRPGDRLLELGSGNGAVLLLLAGRTEVACAVGLEIQPVLVEMARRSILLNGLTGRVEVRLGDLRRDETLPPEPFDLVVANPPYLRVDGGTRSPLGSLAIARHELACTLEEVVRAAARCLKEGGRLVMVHRALRLAELFTELKRVCLAPKRLAMVHPRPGARAALILVEAHAGARAGLMVMPPIFVRDESGDFTPEMEEVFAGRWPWRS